MKNLKLPVFLNTPLGLVLAVQLSVFVANVIIMPMLPGHEEIGWVYVLDAGILAAVIAPILHLAIFRPLRARQLELERQIDELRRLQKSAINRELRMQELKDENAALKARPEGSRE